MEEDFKQIFDKAEAYWIAPDGKFMAVQINHINTVIDKPEFFGILLSEIQEIYNEESEEMGIEGKARERIILSLVRKGFIRIRYYRKRSSWTINVHSLSYKGMNILRNWAVQMLACGFSGQDAVIIDLPERIKEETLSSLSSVNII